MSVSQKPHFKFFKIVGFLLLCGVIFLLFFLSNPFLETTREPHNSQAALFDLDSKLLTQRRQGPPIKWDSLGLTKKSLRNKAIYISFWATWCEPCEEELPLFEKYQKMIQEKSLPVKIILINVDEEEDKLEAQAMALRLMPSLSSLYKRKDIQTLFDVEILPYHLLLDKKHKIAGEFYGNLIDFEEHFEKLLYSLATED